MTNEPNARQRFSYLRSVCRGFDERMMLGDAIKNGWTAEALTKFAENARTPYGGGIRHKHLAYRYAIQNAAARQYSPTRQQEAI
jgi:hypothetical protein